MDLVSVFAARPEGKPPPDNQGNLSPHQFRRQRLEPIDLIIGPAVFDGHVFALNETGFFQSLMECTQAISVSGCRVKKSDNQHRWPLRARGERPCND
ncbi:MAG: hypothetical protein WB689_23165 [Xanthobacteraceae bacterium]